MKLTNKQHTDYCEILNNFRCKAIDIIDELTKEYKDTLAEDIDAKLNDYKKHNEELIVKIQQLELNQNQKAIECLKEVKKNCEKVGEFGFLTILTDEEFDETYIGEYVDHLRIKEIIDNKIKELEGEK